MKMKSMGVCGERPEVLEKLRLKTPETILVSDFCTPNLYPEGQVGSQVGESQIVFPRLTEEMMEDAHPLYVLLFSWFGFTVNKYKN